MLRLQDLTPDVYYRQSRDFQFIGRLYDLVLNSVKTEADLLYTLPLSDNSDERLIDLMALTLGFKSRHHYNVKQLSAMCSAFAYILRNKGNITSILTACNTLLNAEGIPRAAEYELLDNNTKLRLYLPIELTDINLIKDLLVYILPAGMQCEIIKEATVKAPKSITEASTLDEVKIYKQGTYMEGNPALYDNNEYATVIRITDTDPDTGEEVDTDGRLTEALAKDTKGIIANSNVYGVEPTPDSNGD